ARAALRIGPDEPLVAHPEVEAVAVDLLHVRQRQCEAAHVVGIGHRGFLPDRTTSIRSSQDRAGASPWAASGEVADSDGMSESGPALHMLNLMEGDMPASLDFYRRLGVAVPDGDDAVGAHVELCLPSGFSLELDTAESARLWHAGWRADPASAHVVVGF